RVAKRDGAKLQVIYYDQGVGTGNFFDRLTGGAFGDGVEANICDAYRFLIGNYDPGDEIYLFGFSRGAYTVRSIGGMIRKCGILARPCVKHYHAAIELYRGGGHAETGLSDIALDWMLGKARSAGLAFDGQALAAYPLHGNPLGKLHDSKTGLYRLTVGIDRAIGGDPTQSLHPSVRQRWEDDASY